MGGICLKVRATAYEPTLFSRAAMICGHTKQFIPLYVNDGLVCVELYGNFVPVYVTKI